MVHLVVFVNLFFVPVLPLYMIYQKEGKLLRLNLDLLFQYCIAVACNIPLTKVFIFFAKKLGGIFISIDSGYYTLAALVSAVLLHVLYVYQGSELRVRHWAVLLELCNKLYRYCHRQYVYYKNYWKEKFWKGKVGQKGARRIFGELAPAYILVFAAAL